MEILSATLQAIVEICRFSGINGPSGLDGGIESLEK